MVPRMNRASDLRVERLRVGVSGEKVAKALGISKSALYYYETGERTVPDGIREKIRKYLLTRSTLGG
jgi:transcriptional regulator with XRE-family HTH domain